jgi:hypothetical protein
VHPPCLYTPCCSFGRWSKRFTGQSPVQLPFHFRAFQCKHCLLLVAVEGGCLSCYIFQLHLEFSTSSHLHFHFVHICSFHEIPCHGIPPIPRPSSRCFCFSKLPATKTTGSSSTKQPRGDYYVDDKTGKGKMYLEAELNYC